ncbi:unnamed protein product, partial [Arabidopsis halleri]
WRLRHLRSKQGVNIYSPLSISVTTSLDESAVFAHGAGRAPRAKVRREQRQLVI